jgi:hypothetical protein
MANTFIERTFFTNNDDAFSKTIVRISVPSKEEDESYICKIDFSNLKKYDTYSKGVDSFNCVEGALAYVYAICINSEDPIFYLSDVEGAPRINGGNGRF